MAPQSCLIVLFVFLDAKHRNPSSAFYVLNIVLLWSNELCLEFFAYGVNSLTAFYNTQFLMDTSIECKRGKVDLHFHMVPGF